MDNPIIRTAKHMNILIVEDEKLSARKLENMLKKLIPQHSIVSVTDSVRATLDFLQMGHPVDLGFFDIQLADGLSFEIFENTHIVFPVIFTTAFNEYAVQAFKVNSIDYLLKPVDENSLKYALDQFESQRIKPAVWSDGVIAKALNMLSRKYKSRFLVKVGEHLRVINAEEIAYFYSMEKAVFLKTLQNREYAIDFSLDQLSELLDPEIFFRISRKHIISMIAVTDIIAYSGSRLKIKFSLDTPDDMLVSREKVNLFKLWLGR